MAFTTYSEVKAEILDWSHRNDLAGKIDSFIDLCEADLWKRLRIRDMEASTTDTASARTLALPTNYLQMRRLYISSGGTAYECQLRTPESMTIRAESGRPRFYTITTQVEFDRTPDTSYTINFQYYNSLTALSSSNTSNAVLTRFPQLYLYGSLHHLYTYTLQEDKAAYYLNLFEKQIRDVNAQEAKGRHSAAPVQRVEGSTP